MGRSPICRSSCQNLLPTGKDELAGAAPIKSSDTLTPTPVLFCAPTLAPATAPTVTPSYNNKLFKQFMKAYLETQAPS